MATITPINTPHTRIDNEIIDDYLPQIGTYGHDLFSDQAALESKIRSV